jgi:hypothetical protein
MARHGYRGDGAYGQFCVVLPEHDAVIAMTSATVAMQAVLDAMWDHLLPAFGDAPLAGREKVDGDLAERLSALALPPAPGKPVPLTEPESWSGAEFAPDGGTCAAQPGLTRVAVRHGDEGWSVSLIEGSDRLDLRVGGEADWTVGAPASVPTAVTGGWIDPDTLAVDIVFLETPHRLAVRCSLARRTFHAYWKTAPLREAPLRSLRAPRA